ncbi:MAG: hypothetical protein JW705_00515 [Methanosarcinaceae archaeon]|nr:hypothetical protein [Methanosarcinaceae archaeon]
MDNNVVIEKAIERIAKNYGFDVQTVRKAIIGADDPLDLERMVDEGIFCFRGPDDEIRYDNASICLSNRILSSVQVARILLPGICARIRNWNREDLNVLLADLKKAVSIMELNPDAYPGLASCGLDIEALPSEKVPEDIEGRYRVWAMDKKGMCLVGIDADKVMHVDEIRKTLEQEV